MKLLCRKGIVAGLAVLAMASQIRPGAADTLRLLTWKGYAPSDVVEMFKAETGHDVEVIISNNEDIIARLRDGVAGEYDLAQPSQDRIAGPQAEFGIYKPIDMARIDTSQIIGSLAAATKANASIDGYVYGVPHVWGTSGLVVDASKASEVRDYLDLCRASLAGKVSYRLKRPTLIGFAFAMGLNPFAAYGDPQSYTEVMNKVESKLIECKPAVKSYWETGDELMALVRSGEVIASMAWDTGGWKLNAENPEIVFVAPLSGALGWIDTFALPAVGDADSAAYDWINFVMRPEVSALITEESGNFTASEGADRFASPDLRARFQASFPPSAISNIRWYPPVPAGLETIEAEILARVKAAD